MNLAIKSYDSAEVVQMPEKLTIENASVVKEELISMVESGRNRLVLDMTGVNFTDSSGLAVLVAAYKGTAKSNGRTVLLSPQPIVQSLLELTRLQELFEIFEDSTAAVKRVNES